MAEIGRGSPAGGVCARRRWAGGQARTDCRRRLTQAQLDALPLLYVEAPTLNRLPPELANDLHGGELEVLALALEREDRTVLSDDLAARDAAHLLGLVPVGALGVVIGAYERGIIGRDAALESLERLRSESSLHLIRQVYEIAVRRVIST